MRKQLTITAVLVLFVLLLALPTTTAGIVAPDYSPGPALIDALETVKPGGSVTSREFILTECLLITGKDLKKTGLDPHSIIFDSEVAQNGVIETGIVDGNYSYIKHNGKTQMRNKATVICGITGDLLLEALGYANIQINVDPTELCGQEEYKPCCIVMLQKNSEMKGENPCEGIYVDYDSQKIGVIPVTIPYGLSTNTVIFIIVFSLLAAIYLSAKQGFREQRKKGWKKVALDIAIILILSALLALMLFTV